MTNQAYYRFDDQTGCDASVQHRQLVVNCAGVCVLPEPFTSHNTRSDHYLMALQQGELEMRIGGRVQTVTAGQAVVHPPGEEYWYSKRRGGDLVYYWAHFTGAGAQGLVDGCGLAGGPLPTGVGTDIPEAFGALFREFIFRDACFETAAASTLMSICVLLRRLADGGGAQREPNPAARVRRSLDHMHRHYSDPISVTELARIEHLSVSRYCAVFRQCMGVSPQAFLIDLRLGMATQLMLRTDLSLKQIARTVGYDDQLYFSRLFRARKGVSPRSYVAAADAFMPARGAHNAESPQNPGAD